MYAHVATDPAYPGQLALQYWLFYAFNDFNNLHEGDWEMIQLDFRARDAASALETAPVQVGYSSHEGAERADWGDDKLELVDRTHPVVYPSQGSHANKFTQALYVGSSAEAGVGCDNTQNANVRLRPVVETIPSDPSAARKAFPWITFEGRWGELQPAFFNGPTGPNLKTQWTQPITWAQSWRTRSYAVPTGGALGTSATDFFCRGVATVSRGLVSLLREPAWTILVLAGIVAILLFASSRTIWHPVAPLRLARRRAWGQTLRAAGRMYRTRPRLFLGIGVILIPLGAVISIAQALVLGGFGLLGIDTTGSGAGGLVIVVLAVGTTFALLGFALVQAATTCALLEIDAGRPVGAWQAYRVSLRRAGTLVGGLAVAVVVSTALWVTWFLIPVAIWLAVRWALLAQVVELERLSADGQPPSKRRAGAASLVARGVARRCGERARPPHRPVRRRAPDPRDGRAAAFPESRRGRGLRARNAVRGAHDVVRLLRRTSAPGASERARARRAPSGDRALDLRLSRPRGRPAAASTARG